MNDKSQSLSAQTAIEQIRKQYGKEMICCGCMVPGMKGDGFLQPDDPPECCQSPDTNVGLLLDQIAVYVGLSGTTC